MDAKFIVHFVSSPSTVNLMFEPLLTDCRYLIQTFPYHTVTHVFGEANSCADCLACMGAILNHDFDVNLLYNPPDVVVDLLAKEKAGIAYFNSSVVYPKKKRSTGYMCITSILLFT